MLATFVDLRWLKFGSRVMVGTNHMSEILSAIPLARLTVCLTAAAVVGASLVSVSHDAADAAGACRIQTSTKLTRPLTSQVAQYCGDTPLTHRAQPKAAMTKPARSHGVLPEGQLPGLDQHPGWYA